MSQSSSRDNQSERGALIKSTPRQYEFRYHIFADYRERAFHLVRQPTLADIRSKSMPLIDKVAVADQLIKSRQTLIVHISIRRAPPASRRTRRPFRQTPRLLLGHDLVNYLVVGGLIRSNRSNVDRLPSIPGLRSSGNGYVSCPAARLTIIP